MSRNERETGGRILKERADPPETDQDAALPARPNPYGLTRPVDETEEKTRVSNGTDPAPKRDR